MCRSDGSSLSQNGDRQRGADFTTSPGRLDPGPQFFTTSLHENVLFYHEPRAALPSQGRFPGPFALGSLFGQWNRGGSEDWLFQLRLPKAPHYYSKASLRKLLLLSLA